MTQRLEVKQPSTYIPGTCNRDKPNCVSKHRIHFEVMPCMHSVTREAVPIAGGASTSNRCEQAAAIQRVLLVKRSVRQLHRQLKRCRFSVRTRLHQCHTQAHQQIGRESQTLAAQLGSQEGEHQAQAHEPSRIGRCLLQSFAFAAALSLLTPEASYGAESLPIGLVKSWLVSIFLMSASFYFLWHSCVV